MNRMNPRYKFRIWPGVRKHCAECFSADSDGVFRSLEIGKVEPQSRCDKDVVNNVIGVPWRLTDDRWTVDRPEVRVDPIPISPLPFARARTQRERITKQDNDEFRATVGCPSCSATKDGKRAQAHSDRCRVRIETERLYRRSEVINGVAEEIQLNNKIRREAAEVHQQHHHHKQQHQYHMN